MAIVRAQMSWVRDSGLTEDTVTNTWFFRTDDPEEEPDGADMNTISDALNAFYNSLADRYAAHLGTTRTFKLYNMEDDEPRVVIYEESYTPTAPTNQGFPGEVALCLSFQAPPESGTLQSRRRGRVFLGPLAMASANTSEVAGDTRPSSATITAIDSAYTTLITALAAITPAYRHAVFSPTVFALNGNAYNASVEVGEAWVDNSYDTQRRRGAKPTVRTTILP